MVNKTVKRKRLAEEFMLDKPIMDSPTETKKVFHVFNVVRDEIPDSFPVYQVISMPGFGDYRWSKQPIAFFDLESITKSEYEGCCKAIYVKRIENKNNH